MPFQNRIEIMAPAGSFESLAAALQGGADSVYFGVGKLNMRSRATVNFSEEDLPEIVERCHEAGAKAYLTLNIIVYDEELEAVHALCDAARKAGVDAVIASDLAVISYARSIGLEVHMSVRAYQRLQHGLRQITRSTRMWWCWPGNSPWRKSGISLNPSGRRA